MTTVWTLRRILLVIVVLSSVAIVSTMVWMEVTYQRFATDTFNDTTGKRLEFQVQQRVDKQHFAKITPFINEWSRFSSLVNGMKEQNADKVISAVNQMMLSIEVINTRVRLRNVVVYDADMQVFATVDKGYDESLTAKPSIIKRLKDRDIAGQRHISAYLWRTSQGRPVHSVIAPIGGFRAIGYIEFVTDPIPRLTEIGSTFNGIFKLLDAKNGNVLFQDGRLPNTQTGAQLINRLHLETLDIEIPDSMGGLWAVASITRDVSAFKAKIERLRNEAIIIVAIVIFSIILVGWSLLRFAVFDMLKKFSQAMLDLSQGNTDVNIPQTGPDEFNVMHTSLGGLRQAVRMRDSLQKKTEQALSELAHTQQELERQNIILEELSITDHLTKLFNRSKLDKVLLSEIARAERYGHHFGVMLLDIDHFKNVNDTHGHHVGDDVLVTIAFLLKKHTRTNDIVGRWGGEEFLIICPETNRDGVLALAEKLRASLENCAFPVVGQKTSSFGVSMYLSGDIGNSIVARADKALYKAKSNGRNCIEIL